MAEAVRNQLGRAQEILDLLSTEEWVTSATIAALVGQSGKSAKRYISSLRDAGYEVESARGKGYRLEGSLGEGRLRLSEDEMLVLFLSLERCTADFPPEIIDRLKRRLQALLSRGRREQAQSLEISKQDGTRAFFENLDCIRAISKARETKRLLRVTYQGNKDGQPRRRTLQPLRFAPQARTWILEAWDVEAGKEKSFRLDRIRDAICLNEPALALPKTASIDHHPWDFGGEPIRVRLRLRPDLARWLSENPEHPSQTLTTLPNGDQIAEFTIRCQGKFLDWLIGIRGFELLGPPELQTLLRERAENLSKTLGTLNVPWEVSVG